MNRFAALCALLIMLAGLCLGGSVSQAQEGAPPVVPAQQASRPVYVPMVGTGRASGGQPPATPVPPTPVPPAQRSAFFAIREAKTYNAVTAVDRTGVHLAFYMSDEGLAEKQGQAAYYVFCPGDTATCADPGKWGTLIKFSSQVNEVQVLSTPDGRPRMLLRRHGAAHYEYEYWACEQQCSNGNNWTGLMVINAAGVDLYSAEHPQHSFALDSQGRPRFVHSNSWGNGRQHGVYYSWCDAADCTMPDTWDHVLLRTMDYKTVTADYMTLVFNKDDEARVLWRINHSGLPVYLEYVECDGECGFWNSWAGSRVPHPEGRMWANWDLALDAQGNPRIALYEAPGIDIKVGGKLFYGTCDGKCWHEDEAFKLVQVAQGEGRNVDLAIDGRGRTHMVYDAGQRGALGQLWCDGNCMDAGQWQRRILETNEQLMADWAPASPFSCDQQVRAWLDAIPMVAFDGAGNMVVAYDLKNVATCFYQDPTRPNDPPGSRVERLWWAVRWARFTQP